jgi:UDP-2,4-diacetamido-2,4,6-trideoxy-beta-L-altropyranose hydrolase
MNVVFRVDASKWIGSGHVVRCLVLADELKRRSFNISFACLPQESDLIAYIESRGYSVCRLTQPVKPVIPKHNADYQGWLQRSQTEDAEDFIANAPAFDVVIIDHYGIDHEWHYLVKKNRHSLVVVIDDLVRAHDADLVIDQTYSRNSLDYSSNSKVLAGSKYALLRPSFSLYRAKAIVRKLEAYKPKILISFGGIDAPNATMETLKVLVSWSNATCTVLLGANAPHFEEVKSFCFENDNLRHIDYVENMASLMLEHDISIGAPGTTTWERACLGLPSIVIPIADNQKEIASILNTESISICLSIDDIDNKLDSSLRELLSNLDSYKTKNLSICDGLGVFRIATELKSLLANGCRIKLVEASQEHTKKVYEWQCLPETRKYALNPEPPSWDEHALWMTKKLESGKDYFYIISSLKDGLAIGVVRLDWLDDVDYLISIFIDPSYFGCGIAGEALLLIDSIHPQACIHATVLEENIASQRLFEKAGYSRKSATEFLREPIGKF